MAQSVNKVFLIGNLGREPEIRRLNNGDQVANLSVATSESWKDKSSGEWKERTEWHRIVIFNDHFVSVAERLSKGAKVHVEGQLQTRKWTDQSGVEKYSTEIVLTKFKGELIALDARRDDERGGESEPRQQSSGFGRGAPAQQSRGGSYSPPVDDDIPFNAPWA